MTRSSPFSEDVAAQASAWVVRLHGDAAHEADYQAHEAWLNETPEHAAAYAEAEGLWAALGADRAALDAALARAAGASGATSLAKSSAKRAGRRRWIVAGGLAAAVAAAVVIFPMLGDRAVVYQTAPGEQRTVTLADGSTIAMNGGSRLSVKLSDRERLVEMGSAQAEFDVAHDAGRPFTVRVGESRIEVLGTAFDIRRDGETTRVAVSRGVVRVSDLADPGRNVRLTKGQAVSRADADGVLVVAPAPAEVAGWRVGRLSYDNRPLSEVAADLSRAWPTPVRAVGPAASIRFTGILVLDDPASTLRRLEAFVPVSAVQGDGVVELRAR